MRRGAGMLAEEAGKMRRIGKRQLFGDILDRLRGEKVYVTFDIDGIDPAYAPGTTAPVPGGYTSSEAIRMVRHLKGFNTVGFDVVEVQPRYDVGDMTSIVAATLLFEYLSTL